MIRCNTVNVLFDHWGVRWVAEFIWDQEALGTGKWFPGRTEVLVFAQRTEVMAVAAKGDTLLLSDAIDPVLRIKRARHSEKPEEFRKVIEEISPAPRIELFARTCAPGWDRWGIEAGRNSSELLGESILNADLGWT